MKKIITGMMLVASLAGCASWGDLQDGMQNLVGKPLDNAIAKLGYPASEQTIAGRKLYRWNTSSVGSLPVATTSTTTGSAGAGLNAVGYTARTTGTAYETVSYRCQITLEVDKDLIVRKGQSDGNLGGCEPYIKALKQ